MFLPLPGRFQPAAEIRFLPATGNCPPPTATQYLLILPPNFGNVPNVTSDTT
jgi:hypothetical protein